MTHFLYEQPPFFRSQISLSFENYKRYSLSPYIILVVFFMRNPMNLVSSQSNAFDFFFEHPVQWIHYYSFTEEELVKDPQ